MIDHASPAVTRPTHIYIERRSKSDSSQSSTKEADKQPKSSPSQSIGGNGKSVCTGHETFETSLTRIINQYLPFKVSFNLKVLVFIVSTVQRFVFTYVFHWLTLKIRIFWHHSRKLTLWNRCCKFQMTAPEKSGTNFLHVMICLLLMQLNYHRDLRTKKLTVTLTYQQQLQFYLLLGTFSWKSTAQN